MAEQGARPRRIGVLGGSFDPVHQAHRHLADAALEQLALDEVRWVVSARPWQKAGRELAPAEDRAAMVALVIADDPRHVLERHELEHDGRGFMVDTLDALRDREPQPSEWFLILGEDQYANFHTWHRWQRILEVANLAVAGRGGIGAATDAPIVAVPHRCIRIAMAPETLSATEIRRLLAAGVEASSLSPHWLAPPVAAYIEREQLYHRHPAAG